MSRCFTLTVCLLGVAFTGTVVWRAGSQRIVKGTDDFLPLYAGARLVGTPELYHPRSIYREEIEASGEMGDSLLCTRMPWVPLLLWPLGRLPYSVAHWVWLGLRTAGVIAFIWIWPHNPRWITAMAVSWFLPVMAALGTGQDAICILFWLGVWQRLEPKRPFLSGLAIALCTAKFHLFLLLPVYLIANRKWRVIAGASTGIAALLALSFLANGWTWPMDYLRVLSNPIIHTGQSHMYSLHGLLSLPFTGELAVSVVVALLAIWGIWKLRPAYGLAIALSGGLLLSYHAYLMDCVVLLPGALLMFGRNQSAGGSLE
jgi:Glycosyltransferase family 87